jgi:hypothetical protein
MIEEYSTLCASIIVFHHLLLAHKISNIFFSLQLAWLILRATLYHLLEVSY